MISSMSDLLHLRIEQPDQELDVFVEKKPDFNDRCTDTLRFALCLYHSQILIFNVGMQRLCSEAAL